MPGLMLIHVDKRRTPDIIKSKANAISTRDSNAYFYIAKRFDWIEIKKIIGSAYNLCLGKESIVCVLLNLIVHAWTDPRQIIYVSVLQRGDNTMKPGKMVVIFFSGEKRFVFSFKCHSMIYPRVLIDNRSALIRVMAHDRTIDTNIEIRRIWSHI